MTEISASDYLESLRREQEGLLDLSFDTICGYADMEQSYIMQQHRKVMFH